MLPRDTTGTPAEGMVMDDSYGVTQVIVPPSIQEPLREWLASRGLNLYQIPVEDDLPTYGVGTTDPAHNHESARAGFLASVLRQEVTADRILACTDQTLGPADTATGTERKAKRIVQLLVTVAADTDETRADIRDEVHTELKGRLLDVTVELVGEP
jgi:hypothetical protein